MIITNTINSDLWIRERTQEIYAVQGDSCTRKVTVKLFANHEPWAPEEDVSVVIRYHKPDGSGGSYDTLPNGEKAWELTDNAVSFILAPQMLSVPGRVAVQVELLWENGILASFPLHIRVEENVAAGITRSGNFFNWEQRLEWERRKTLEQAKQSGVFDGPVGATPNLQIGTVSTLEAGAMASAVIRGTPEDPILDLALPRGADVVVDAALTAPGCAADAAATGAALALKAPAGYGLGRSMSPTITEIDNHLVNGWLRYDGEIEGYSNGWSGMQYMWDGPGNGCQILRHRYHCFEIIRYRRADEWQPWEWVNSPMEVGVEYRTTERYMGKAVYTKRMNLGALPNASTQTYNSLSTGAVDILDYALTISGKNGDSYANNGLVHEVGQSGGGALWAQIKTSSNLSAYTGCITLKYTKD